MFLTKKLLIISSLIVAALTLVQTGISAYGIPTQILNSIASSNSLYGESSARTIAQWLDEKKNILNAFVSSLERSETTGQMIDKLQSTTSSAVSVMNLCHTLATQSVEDTSNAAASFKEIKDSTDLINSMAAQIATAAEEQVVVSKEINTNTESIKVISDQLSDDAVEGAKQADLLNKLSENLIGQVSKFKIKD